MGVLVMINNVMLMNFIFRCKLGLKLEDFSLIRAELVLY